MATSLKEFLKQKASQQTVESAKNRITIEEWQAAVEALLTQLEAWLAAADPDAIIQRERTQIDRTEPGLGRYQIAALQLRAFGKWVGVLPNARKTAKRAAPQRSTAEQATGRVDITDEIRRYILYRFGDGPGAPWFIDDAAANTDLQPLTAERFEAALLTYLG